jgi:hypothetical protein
VSVRTDEKGFEIELIGEIANMVRLSAGSETFGKEPHRSSVKVVASPNCFAVPGLSLFRLIQLPESAPRAHIYLSASLTASMPACAQVSSWSAGSTTGRLLFHRADPAYQRCALNPRGLDCVCRTRRVTTPQVRGCLLQASRIPVSLDKSIPKRTAPRK